MSDKKDQKKKASEQKSRKDRFFDDSDVYVNGKKVGPNDFKKKKE